MATLSDLVFSNQGFLGLRDDFATNIVAGVVTFTFEILLIVVLLPLVLHCLEERKWRSTRKIMGERLFLLNERLANWWIHFTSDSLDKSKYDGTIRTPKIFEEFDRVIEQFSFAMNPSIANAYSDYRQSIAQIESLYRKLCLAFGGNTVGNIVNYSSDLLNDRPVSFADVRSSLLKLLRELDYKPTHGHWWDPPKFQEALPSGTDMVAVRQGEADFIRDNMPSIGTT